MTNEWVSDTLNLSSFSTWTTETLQEFNDEGFPWWPSGEEFGIVTAVVWVRSLAQELLHDVDVTKKKKKKKNLMIRDVIFMIFVVWLEAFLEFSDELDHSEGLGHTWQALQR